MMSGEIVRDARFWVAVVLLIKTVLFYAVPTFPPEVWAAVDGVLAVVIGALAGQSAARIAGEMRRHGDTGTRGVAEARAGRYVVSLVDVLLVLGLALLAGGLGGYDWRLALIACGALLLVGGAVGMVRGS